MHLTMTKKEYYQSKNIPPLVYCYKLQPELNIRNHLLDPLPRLVTQVQKIYSNNRQQNKANLELGNALKIIHQLQDQLQLMYSQKDELESLYYQQKAQKDDLLNKISRLESQICELQNSIKRNEFQAKSMYDKETQKYNIIIFEYNKKVQQLNQQIQKIKNKSQKQKQEIIRYHRQQLGWAQNQTKNIHQISMKSMKNLQSNYGQINSENTQFRQKIFQLQRQNQRQVSSLQKNLQQQIQDNKKIKIELQQKILAVTTQLQILNNNNTEKQDKIAILQRRLRADQQAWLQQQIQWKNIQKDIENSWKNKLDGAYKQKDRVSNELQNKSRQLNEQYKKISDMEFTLNKNLKNIEELKNILDSKEREKVQKCVQIQNDFDQQLRIRVEELKQNIEHELHIQNSKKIDSLKSQLNEAHQLAKSRLNGQLKSVQQKKCQLEYCNREMEDRLRKLQRSYQIQKKQNQMYQQKQKQYRQKLDQVERQLELEHNIKVQKTNKLHENKVNSIKEEYQLEIHGLKQYFETQKKEYNDHIDLLMTQKKKMEDKFTGKQQEFEIDRMSFIQQIQTLTKRLQTLKQQFDNISQTNKNNLQQINIKKSEISTLQYSIQQQVCSNRQLCRQLKQVCEKNNSQNSEITDLKALNQKLNEDLQNGRYQYESKIIRLTKQIQASCRRNQQYLIKIRNQQDEIKRLQREKIGIQKEIMERDESSKQKWQKINNDFELINEKIIRQATDRQNQLIESLEQLSNQNKDILTKHSNLQLEFSKLKSQSSNDKKKLNQIQQQNHKLKIHKDNLQKHTKQLQQKQKAYQNLKNSHQRILTDIQLLEKQCNCHKQKINSLQFEIDRLKTQKRISEGTLKSNNNKIQTIQHQKVNLINKVNQLQKQMQNRHQDRIQEMSKLKQQLKQVSKTLEEQRLKYNEQIQEKVKESKQNEFGLVLKLQEQSEIYKKQKYKLQQINEQNIGQIQYLKQQLHNRQKQIQKINKDKNDNYDIITRQHGQLQKTVSQYEQKMHKLQQNLANNRKIYEIERTKISELKAQNEEIKQINNQMKINSEQLLQQIDKLNKNIDKNQKDIQKIYQQNDQRLEQSKKEVSELYQREIAQKDIRIRYLQETKNSLQKQIKQQSQRFHQQSKRQQQNYFIKITQKNERINQLTIENQTISQQYEVNWQQLQCIKNKWSKVFNDLGHFDTDLNTGLKTPSQHKTEEKRTIKFIKETRTDQLTNQRIIHRNRFEAQQSFGSESRTESQCIAKAQAGKPITRLLRDSDSDVINSRQIEEHSRSEIVSESKNSLRQRCSSKLKKYNKQ